MISDELASEIWRRVARGRPLNDLVPMHQGRLDLRGLRLPAQPAQRKPLFGFGLRARAETPHFIERTTWQGLDFSGANLSGLQLSRVNVVNCSFDRCKLRDLRVWSSTFTDCAFVSANLRNAALGGVDGDVRNSYLRVDFSDADLRGTAYEAAAFETCAFRFAKLDRVDFQTSTFKDCVFEGQLKDVLFYRHGFKGERFPPNEMINVDFRRAQLHDVAFRGLTLQGVTFPEDTNHVVFEDYAATLRRVVPILLEQGDETARSLVYFLEMDRQWLPEGERVRRVINVKDLEETAGPEAVQRLRTTIGTAA